MSCKLKEYYLISQLCNSFLSISFYHVPRLNNADAEALAKVAVPELYNLYLIFFAP